MPGAGGPGRGGEVRGQDGTAPSRQRCTEGSGAPGVQRSVPGRTRAARGFSGAAQCPPRFPVPAPPCPPTRSGP